MAQINDTGSATGLLANMLQEAIFTASERSIAGKLVSVYDMTGTPGLTAQVPVYPEISASTPGDGVDVEAASHSREGKRSHDSTNNKPQNTASDNRLMESYRKKMRR